MKIKLGLKPHSFPYLFTHAMNGVAIHFLFLKCRLLICPTQSELRKRESLLTLVERPNLLVIEKYQQYIYFLLKPKSVFLPIKNTIATTTRQINPKEKYGDKPNAVGISPKSIHTIAIRIAYGNCVLT